MIKVHQPEHLAYFISLSWLASIHPSLAQRAALKPCKRSINILRLLSKPQINSQSYQSYTCKGTVLNLSKLCRKICHSYSELFCFFVFFEAIPLPLRLRSFCMPVHATPFISQFYVNVSRCWRPQRLAVNFINILLARCSYKSASRSFSLVTFWLWWKYESTFVQKTRE